MTATTLTCVWLPDRVDVKQQVIATKRKDEKKRSQWLCCGLLCQSSMFTGGQSRKRHCGKEKNDHR